MADFIHFRSSPELDELIEGRVQELRDQGLPRKIANRSAVARTLLLTALQDDERKAVVEEVMRRVWGAAQSVTNQAVSAAMAMVPDLLEAELDALEADEG